MGMGRLLTMLVVLVLSFVGAIFLESKMEQYATLELVIIVVGILLSIMALVGIASEARWAWPFTTILFSLSLANLVFLHVNVGAFLTFVLLLLVNIFGMLIAVLSIEDVEQAMSAWNADTTGAAPLETYAVEPEAQVTYKASAAKAKKAGRKKKR
jgi:hypothetical protein